MLQTEVTPLNAYKKKIAIVASRFNSFLVNALIQGAEEAFLQHGGQTADLQIFRAPGALELPYVCQKVIQRADCEGIVALGVVIQGQTSHYDLVVNGAFSGLQQVILAHQKPITFGILTTANEQQAMDRSGLKHGNKGAEAMLALIEILNLTV